jgi:hypothetical protein
MSVYLIPLDQAAQVKDVPQDYYAEAWESQNPEFPAGAWATAETLEGLRAIGVEPVILAEYDDLPVFHSLGSYIDTADYAPALSAICLAGVQAGAIRGVSYVGYNCEAQVAGELLDHRDRDRLEYHEFPSGGWDKMVESFTVRMPVLDTT